MHHGSLRYEYEATSRQRTQQPPTEVLLLRAVPKPLVEPSNSNEGIPRKRHICARERVYVSSWRRLSESPLLSEVEIEAIGDFFAFGEIEFQRLMTISAS